MLCPHSRVVGKLLSPARHTLDTQLVVDGVHDPLPGAEVPLRGLYGPVSKQQTEFALTLHPLSGRAL
jgi:hypothetical protein